MVHYIKELIQELTQELQTLTNSEMLLSRFETVTEEIDRLDPRDFVPAYRFEFVDARRRLRGYMAVDQNTWKVIDAAYWGQMQRSNTARLGLLFPRLDFDAVHLMLPKNPSIDNQTLARTLLNETVAFLGRVGTLLDGYVGPEQRTKSRTFSFVSDTDLRQILERDYRELTLNLYPTGSWKSTVIIAGSILEGLLHDLLTRDTKRVSDAEASGRAPQRVRYAPPRGPRKLLSDAVEDQWMLNDLIEVAEDLSLLPTGWKVGIQSVLREFRNYVHPRKELKATDKISQGDALQSVGALIRICDHIEKNHP